MKRRTQSPRQLHKPRMIASAIEALEGRVLLSHSLAASARLAQLTSNVSAATTDTWIASGSGNWSNPLNWSRGVPGPRDAVIIDKSGALVTLNTAATVASIQNEASLTVTGILTIHGNYTQTPCSKLQINIGGTTPGSGYDQLQVTGIATLSGTLAVGLVNGYVPVQGTQFNVLTAGAETGFFTSLQGIQISPTTELDPFYTSSGQAAGVTLQADSSAGPALVSTTIGDGSAQRSEVRQLTVKFSEAVTLSPQEFTLLLSNDGGSGTSAGSTATDCNLPTDATAAIGQPTTPDGGVTWIIPILPNTAFSDATGSLDDGIYSFTVHGANVAARGLLLSGWDQTVTFHRLFGDIDANGIVNNADYFKFSRAFGKRSGDPAFVSLFDYDGNGTINNLDYFQFSKRFGMTLM